MLGANPPGLDGISGQRTLGEGAASLAPLEARLNRETLTRMAGASRIMADKPRQM